MSRFDNRFFFVVAMLTFSTVPSKAAHFVQNEQSNNQQPNESNGASVDLSPAKWPNGELKRSLKTNKQIGHKNKTATSQTAVIAGTTGAPAVRAGLEAMKQGGSAADGALTTALAQITLSQGSWNSYAGILTMVYYDAETGKVHSMNAAYNTVLGEEDPLSIPAQASGRTVLVPGFMAGVESAHQRFGKLPFNQLFVPAIYFAENGFELTSLNWRMMSARTDVLSRLQQTKDVFTNPATNKFYQEGELFKQPELARTLTCVSKLGSKYMYTGKWAKKLVKVVNKQGGKLSLEDLKRYKVLWNEPIRVSYNGVEFVLPGLPGDGGVHVAETLNLLSASKINQADHYSKSAESLYWLAQFNTVFVQSYYPESATRAIFGKKVTKAERARLEFANELWSKMRNDEFPLTPAPKNKIGGHSDAVVAIDRWGNVAAICHSINTEIWGRTGINVDGISIPDSATIQKEAVNRAGPGKRLPEMTEPMIVLRNGKPIAAFSSIGAGLHARTMCALTNFLDHDLGLREAIQSPSLHLPQFDFAGNPTQTVSEGDFPARILDEVRKMGLKIKVIPKTARATWGYVIGATIDPSTGRRTAVSTDSFNAPALGVSK